MSMPLVKIELPGEAMQPGDARFLETARWMAHEYRAGVDAMREAVRAIREAGERMTTAFSRAETDAGWANGFDLEVKFDGASTRFEKDGDEMQAIEAKFRRRAWRMLIDHLGVKQLMSVKKRAEFDQQLEKGDLPEVTEDAILATVMDLCGKAGDFAKEAAAEVFAILRPATRHRGSEYKTNDAFRVGRRVVLTYMVGQGYSNQSAPFRVNYQREGEVNAIDSVFHLLDGRGPIKDRVSPLVEAIRTAPGGTGETEYFTFRAFKNGNLHLGFKRLDLVKELNYQGAGERVLGADTEVHK